MSLRSCRRNLNRIRLHRTYTIAEIAEVLGVHVRTVQSWHKAGLEPVEETDRPMLFLGSSVRSFVKQRQRARKRPLQSNQFFCLRCNSQVTPKPEVVSVEVTARRIGRSAQAVLIRGVCPRCNTTVVRFASTKSIFDTPWWTKLQKGDKKLIGISSPYSNTDFKQQSGTQ